jgi:hypothetical protein
MNIKKHFRKKLFQLLFGNEIEIGENTVKIDGSSIKLPGLTANPTLEAGKIWFRSDTGKVLYTPDGTTVKSVGEPLFHVAGDDTAISTTSTSYPTSDQKYFYLSLAGGILPVSKLVVSIEGYVSSGYTLTVGIYVDGTLKAEVSFTETSYTVKTSPEIDLSGLSTTATHQIGIRMKVTGGTGYVRAVDFYLKG